MAVCWNCGKEYEAPDLITRESECPHCAAYLRCCKNCTFFDPAAHNACREPQAELVGDKEVANACDYFRLRGSHTPTRGGTEKSKRDFDDLFKD